MGTQIKGGTNHLFLLQRTRVRLLQRHHIHFLEGMFQPHHIHFLVGMLQPHHIHFLVGMLQPHHIHFLVGMLLPHHIQVRQLHGHKEYQR
ncbi:unnamed protein product [Larinioides sclopetarius]|uniref:Uncharacterized protein n=1 Tax=Larinioides sclopetarius TaxID=280406 RepID=A0AAV2ACF8_9ARAC